MSDTTNDKPEDGQTLTFRELLDKYDIEIPAIQRDYVQGRSDEQAHEALKGLLDDIQTHLTKNTPLSLNFVYGEVARETSETTRDDDKRYVCQPLDGQQRLTTLYLIHWLALAAALAHDPDMDVADALRHLARFSYQTRATSRDFFEKITEPDADGKTGTSPIRQMAAWLASRPEPETDDDSTDAAGSADADADGERPSDFLRDKYWFRPDFSVDPTIGSVLNVLDELCTPARTVFTSPDLWSTLISNDCPIRFEWLDVENIGNGDDLYLKMNARGRQLSDFENLKAEFEQEATRFFPKGADDDDYRDLCRKFDQEWSDFFWDMRGRVPADEHERYDERFMRFMNWSLWNQWATKVGQSSTKTDKQAKDIDMGHTSHRRLSAYQVDLPLKKKETKETILDKTFLNRLTRFLDTVSSKAEDVDPEILDDFIGILVNVCGEPNRVTYVMRMDLESAMAYLDGMAYLGKHPDAASWSGWKRIIGNLSVSAQFWDTTYRNAGRYAQAVRAVELFAKHANDLTGFLATFPDVPGFSANGQYQDEELKAYLMVSDDRWDRAIRDAERMPYFSGDIGFLLAFTGVDHASCAAAAAGASADAVLDRFDRYLAIAKVLFGDATPDSRPDTGLLLLLRRALLTKGDFSLSLIRKKKQEEMDDSLPSPNQNKGTITIRSYIIDTGSNELLRSIGWRVLLHDPHDPAHKSSYNSSLDDNRELMHQLFDNVLDHIDTGSGIIDRDSVANGLNDIINRYPPRTGDDTGSDSNGRRDWWADVFILQPTMWNYMGKLRQYRIEDGICYLPTGDNKQINGLNNELDACVINDMLSTDKTDQDDYVCKVNPKAGRLRPIAGKDKNPDYAEVSSGGQTVTIGKRYVTVPGHKDMVPRIIVTHDGETVECDTPTEAVRTIKNLLGLTRSN